MRLNGEQIKDIKILYETGFSLNEIENKLTISRHAISRRLEQLGLRTKQRKPECGTKNPSNYTNLDFFKEINTEEKAYWLGMIYADGSVISNSLSRIYRLYILLKEEDEQHLQKLADIFNKSLNERYQSCSLSKHNEINRYVFLEINNLELYTDLINIGIQERKTYSEDATILKNIPENLQRHFIRGLFDGDGSISSYKHFNISGTFGFLKAIQHLMIQQIPVNKTKIINTGTCCYLEYGGSGNIQKIYKYMYNNSSIHLDRKYEKFNELITNY